MTKLNSEESRSVGPLKSISNQIPKPISQFLGYVAAILRYIPGPLIGLILLCLVFSFVSPHFFSFRNIVNIFSQVSDIGIMAAGATLVIIIGGIDLSVGAVLAFSLMFKAWLYAYMGVSFPLAVVGGLLAGSLAGLVNGILSTYGRMQPFVATLAVMSICSGLALYITGGSPITGFPDYFAALTYTRIMGVPLDIILMVSVYLIIAFWLNFRPTGRALYAIGGNEEVARLSGLNTDLIKIRVYVLAGLLAAVGGMIVTSRLDTAQPSAGILDLLTVIAVVVIGGASLKGGSGGMMGTFIGLLIIGVLSNGMALLNISSHLQPVVLGIAIITAVMLDRWSKKR